MKNLRQKKIFVVLISVLVLCLIAGAITMLVLHQREEALEEQQNEALQLSVRQLSMKENSNCVLLAISI